MLQIQLASESVSPANLPLQQCLLKLFLRSAAMGVLSSERITAIDAASIRRLVNALQQGNLLRTASIDLAPVLRRDPAQLDPDTASLMEMQVTRLVEALGESPSPVTEWPAMREAFGDRALAPLVGVAESSLRRYAAGSRETPQPVAERLHWLALVVGDLAGGYNAFGIRRWFERPRAELTGKSPCDVLGTKWDAEDKAAQRVRALAAIRNGA